MNSTSTCANLFYASNSNMARIMSHQALEGSFQVVIAFLNKAISRKRYRRQRGKRSKVKEMSGSSTKRT